MPSQLIDLTDMNFAMVTLGHAGNSLSGVLTVSDGSHVAALNMIGNYTIGNFKSASDGLGGTLISDPPVPPGAESLPQMPIQSS